MQKYAFGGSESDDYVSSLYLVKIPKTVTGAHLILKNFCVMTLLQTTNFLYFHKNKDTKKRRKMEIDLN